MKIAMCGTSGAGKTTFANFISQEWGIPFIPTSAGLILTEEDKKYLKELTNGEWQSKGHLDVIKLSAKYPEFGTTFQGFLRKRRDAIIRTNPTFVIDRSPVDNFTYFMIQAGYMLNESECRYFLHQCFQSFNLLTHIIYIKCKAPEIENNQSRVNNLYYQQAIDSIFDKYLTTYFFQVSNQIKMLEIDFWGIGERQDRIRDFLNNA